MPSVADLVEVAELRRLAWPEEYERGSQLADRVRVHAFSPLRVAATVDGSEPADVELTSAVEGLAWNCSIGDAPPAHPCAHAVAVAIVTWRRAPGRRSGSPRRPASAVAPEGHR